jgi:transposase-like protein
MPIAVSKANVHAALDWMAAEDLQHYDVKCPRCRKTNRVSKETLEHAAPDWGAAEEETEETSE